MPVPEERESSIREFNELYFTYRSNFISIARSYVEETAVAEDIVTDSFVAYWVRRHELAADTDPRRYVVGAIKKRCLEHLRNKQIHQRVEKKLQDANDRMLEYHLGSLECCKPEQLYADEVLAILQKRLDEMPELTREIFIASRTEELSYKDIAERFRIPSLQGQIRVAESPDTTQGFTQGLPAGRPRPDRRRLSAEPLGIPPDRHVIRPRRPAATHTGDGNATRMLRGFMMPEIGERDA